MNITRQQLLDAIQQIQSGTSQAIADSETVGVTAHELGQTLNLSREATRAHIRDGLANGTLKHVMVYRDTIGGYRARTHGYTTAA